MPDLAERIARAIAADQGEAYAEFMSEYDSYGRVAAKVIADVAGEAAPQMDRVFIGDGEYVRADAAVRAVTEANSRTRDAEETLKYCERQWSEERGTMIDTIQRLRAEIKAVTP